MLRPRILGLIACLWVVSLTPSPALAISHGQGGPPGNPTSSGSPLASSVGQSGRYVVTFVSVAGHQFGLAGTHWQAKERITVTLVAARTSRTVTLRSTRTGRFLVVVDGIVDQCAQVTARITDIRRHGGIIGKPGPMCPGMAGGDESSMTLTVLQGKQLSG